ncbi:MAG: transposase [Verrucomicrobiales bacterium]
MRKLWRKQRLSRLNRDAYSGHAAVHWTMCMENRATGWLNQSLHLQVREILLHACTRYQVVCPVYVLMPDHGHFLMMGTCTTSDQTLFARFLRTHWNDLLSETELQRQAHDHVLRANERTRDVFQTVAAYILENPVRAGLVKSPIDWPYVGACAPGYPSLQPHRESFWKSYWLAYEALCNRSE